MAHLLADGETNIKYLCGGCNICVVLDVDDEDVVLGGWDDGGECTHKEFVERRQEACVVDGVQAHGQTVVQHVLGDQTHEQTTGRLHHVDSI